MGKNNFIEKLDIINFHKFWNSGRIATIREIDQQRYSHSQEDIEELKEDDNLSDDLQSNYVGINFRLIFIFIYIRLSKCKKLSHLVGLKF